MESLNVEISESLFITCEFSSKQLFTDERNTIYGSKQPRMDFHLGSHALLFLSFLFLPFWAIMYDSYFSFIGNHALLKIKKIYFWWCLWITQSEGSKWAWSREWRRSKVCYNGVSNNIYCDRLRILVSDNDFQRHNWSLIHL